MIANSAVTVLFIGAGNVNFGSPEGPWNHSRRLERKLGDRLRVVGIVDPVQERARDVLAVKARSPEAAAYADTAIFPSVQSAIAALSTTPPQLIIVGCPPAFRGTMDCSSGFDVEQQLTTAFPSAALLVEKPLSTGTVEDVAKVAALLESRKDNIVSVGYMLRYSAAVQMMKEMIAENDLTVIMTSARYVMAYEYSLKPAWWNKSVDCGPIVEQASKLTPPNRNLTIAHFCDLSRYFGGRVDLASIMAHSVEWYEKPGKLSKVRYHSYGH